MKTINKLSRSRFVESAWWDHHIIRGKRTWYASTNTWPSSSPYNKFFSGQMANPLIEKMHGNWIKLTKIQPNMTHLFQPLHLKVIGAAKAYMKKRFTNGIALALSRNLTMARMLKVAVSNWRQCLKIVRIRSYSSPHFPVFPGFLEYLSIFSPNAGKCGPE